jgi:hypothetical protein
VITAAIGTVDAITINVLPPGAAARVSEPAVVTIRSRVALRPGLEEIATSLAFDFPGARQDRFTILLDADLTMAKLDAANVKSWRLSPKDTRQALEITLNEPAENSYQITLEAVRSLPPLPASRTAAQISALAGRVEYPATALFADGAVEVSVQPATAQRQVEWKEDAWRGRFVSAFAGAGPFRYQLSARTSRREARVDSVYQVNRRKIELIASLQLFARGDDLFDTTVALPAGYEVQAVQSPRLQDWWREADALHVRFQGATPDTTPLVVYLVRQFDTAPTELDLLPLKLDGFKRVTGEAVVAAHKSVEAALTLNAEAHEIASDQAARDFQILPPLERKRGFTFQTQNFTGQVKLTPLAAKSDVVWVLHAAAHEGWVALSAHARFTLRQGSLDRATFTLPAALPEVRVSGPEVRETRSRVENARHVYEVQFQNDVSSAVELTLDVEIPSTGAVTLPDLAWPGASFVTGYVLADNASDYEMRLETSGVDPARTADIPFLPELTKNAHAFRVQRQWSVKVNVERLVKAENRSAFVAYAELITALREDGTEWHRSTYHLQNRSLQFLPVRLPAGSELMGARVAGTTVRSDQGIVAGQSALLIPLIKTKPGDLSYDVEVIYRRIGKAPGQRRTQFLDDPDLPGITIERTLWDVWLPPGRDLKTIGGNMEPVIGDVNKTEKLASTVDEMKRLADIVASTSTGRNIRENAWSNYNRLQQTVEAPRSRMFSRSADEFASSAANGVSKQAQTVQAAQTEDRRQKLTMEIQQQSERVEKLGKDLENSSRRSDSDGAEALQIAPQANKNWVLNRGQLVIGGPNQQTVRDNQLYLNDNVSLQNGGLSGQTLVAQGQGTLTTNTAGTNNVSLLGNNAYVNTARGNLSFNDGNNNSAPTNVAAPVVPAAATPRPQIANSTFRGTMGGTASMGKSIPKTEALALAMPVKPATTTPVAPKEEAEKAQPMGRISLAIDFPTEGNLFHFKKVKANAELSLTTRIPGWFDRWPALGVTLLFAAALHFARRWFDARVAQASLA